MDDFHKLDASCAAVSRSNYELEHQLEHAKAESAATTSDIDNLIERVNKLSKTHGMPLIEPNASIISAIDEITHFKLPNDGNKTQRDKSYELNAVDVLVASLAGGLAVLVDFLIVKQPKDPTTFGGSSDPNKISPLTSWLRTIGKDADGNTSKWVEILEKFCKVNYDISVDPEIPGMGPKNHRVFSVAHDPGPVGLLTGIKDLIAGTFTYIDVNGELVVKKTAEVALSKKLFAPILWLGHIISDIFTSQGVPIPGTCLLRMMNFGSIGDKERTIAQIAKFMYQGGGYDLRHLATMSTCNAVITFVLQIYKLFVFETPDENTMPLSEFEYIKVKNEQRYRKLALISYSIATSGNVAKIAVYEGNPLAINCAIWFQFVREVLSNVTIYYRDSTDAESAIEGRHVIDENFNALLNFTY